ncbi:hypothetical protein LTR16_000839 [Cryomyces antarcticus]|uniref:Uncharacterized protein n=1 Tax=Cryomyces antarcticus TaxID=329879 RepID=A0ABR0KVD5_9PEZI|nr:hypothetical protein LTR39_000819 [Cryomyces antarcticus]KAK5020534.1 hypothetical protein LTR60_000426 [Cryomyces antarcticus]KAK5131355.1 hypothetical protein LTR16_000839 [Cryomyces antarcticus]
MLSRANSDTRLRRAKSTSSVHQPPSVAETLDPAIARQHAEVAAAEAYRRARGSEVNEHMMERKPGFHRRKSNATRKSEGSHFQSSRTGVRFSADAGIPVRTRSLKTKEDIKGGAAATARAREEKIISKARSFIDTSMQMETLHTAEDEIASAPSSYHRVRKTRSMYITESPNPVTKDRGSDRRSTGYHDVPRSRTEDGYGGNSSNISDFNSTVDDTVRSFMPSIRETQTDDVVVAMARDKYLQDVQQQRLRERPSFVLGPFRKRQDKPSRRSATGDRVSYDSSLPPFNYPDAPLSAPVVPPRPQAKPRVLSGSLKDKLKRVFRRSSKPHAGLPAQQVEASHAHFNVEPAATGVQASFEDLPLPDKDTLERARSRSPSLSLQHIRSRASSTNTVRSLGEVSNGKSRVTSWATSTAPNTLTTRDGGSKRLSIIDEHGTSHAPSSSTTRRSGSVIGRNIRIPSRKQSKQALGAGPANSQRLYSALMKRIDGSESTDSTSIGGRETATDKGSALDTLPSQTRASSIMSGASKLTKSTIRTVTPKSNTLLSNSKTSRVLAPVPKYGLPYDSTANESTTDLSPREPSRISPEVLRRTRSSQATAPALPLTNYGQRPAVGSTPSADQIAKRAERANERWKSPLEGRSPFFPRSTRHTVIITSHEVMRYSLDSSSKSRPPAVHSARSSRDWRAWLSKEVADLEVSPAAEDLTINEQFIARDVTSLSEELPDKKPSPVQSGHQREEAQIVDGEDTSIGDGRHSPPSNPVLVVKSTRPRLDNKTTSQMNERFPMLVTGRKISGQGLKKRISSQGLKTWRKISPRNAEPAKSAPVTSPQKENIASGAKEEVDGSIFARRRPLSRPQSVQQMSPFARSREDVANRKATISESEATKKLSVLAPPTLKPSSRAYTTNETAHRPKSAFDLRASYTSSNATNAININIRRKPIASAVFEDKTLAKIAEGPYASSPSPDRMAHKENSAEPHTPTSRAAVVDSETVHELEARPSERVTKPRASLLSGIQVSEARRRE